MNLLNGSKPFLNIASKRYMHFFFCSIEKDSIRNFNNHRRLKKNCLGIITSSFQADYKKSSIRNISINEIPTHSYALKFVQKCPSYVQPYLRLMRIDRPIGTWLVFIPCAWSLALSTPAGSLPDLKLLALFGLGSFLMRGAGCIINDMWDKDYDSKVMRTKERPLANNSLSRFDALCFLSLPLSLSLAILLTFNTNTILLGVSSMLPCILYPVAKRFTYWPQFFLGITFNWGAVMGRCAVTNSFDLIMFSIYLSSIFWTLHYDSIYAHQDIKDDLNVGVKSTAIKFGENTKRWLALFSFASSSCLGLTGYLCDQNIIFYLGVLFFGSHLTHQIVTVDLNDPKQCSSVFRSNRNLGLILLVSIIISTLYKKPNLSNNPKDSLESPPPILE